MEVEVAHHCGFAAHAFAEVGVIELDALAKGLFVIKKSEGFADFSLFNDEDIVQEGDEFFLGAVGFIAGKAIPFNGVLPKEVVALAADVALCDSAFFAILEAVGFGGAVKEFRFKFAEFEAFGVGFYCAKGLFKGFGDRAIEGLLNPGGGGGIPDAAQEVGGGLGVPVRQGQGFPSVLDR